MDQNACAAARFVWSQTHSGTDLCFSPAALGCPAAAGRTCNRQNLAFHFARDAAIREEPHKRNKGAEGVGWGGSNYKYGPERSK